ncbi:MAG: hypothetical protein KC492_26660, partial [Myxococcales bacterium]|nr:hypothetical protein [Myxococcales bacterium]
ITVTSVLIGVAAASACSDEDTKKNAKGNPDAGADGSLAGDGGSAGSSTAGTGATGGLSGAGGMGGTGAGGAGGTAGMDASAGTGGTSGGAAGSGGAGGTGGGTGGTGGLAPLICNPSGAAGQGSGGTGGLTTIGIAGMGVGGGVNADAGVAGSATGGTSGSAGSATGGSSGTAGGAGSTTGGSGGSAPTPQWRDWDAYQCRDCPSPTINDCTEFEGGGSTFDVGTRIWTINIKPGTVEVVTATFQFYWEYLDPDAGWISGTATGSFVVDKDTLTADLSAVIPPEVMGFANPRVMLTDACGSQTTIYYGYFQELDPDAGSIINIHCEGGF